MCVIIIHNIYNVCSFAFFKQKFVQFCVQEEEVTTKDSVFVVQDGKEKNAIYEKTNVNQVTVVVMAIVLMVHANAFLATKVIHVKKVN